VNVTRITASLQHLIKQQAVSYQFLLSHYFKTDLLDGFLLVILSNLKSRIMAQFYKLLPIEVALNATEIRGNNF